MRFTNLVTSLYLCSSTRLIHGYGLIPNPIQMENTWRIHDIRFEDEGHPTSKEISTRFTLYRSKTVPCGGYRPGGLNISGLDYSQCGWEWLTAPVGCSWGWIPDQIPNHPRNNQTEPQKVWHECDFAGYLPQLEQDLPKAVSTWLRYRVVEVVLKENAAIGDGPKSVKWQVVRAYYGGARSYYGGEPLRDWIKVESVTFSLDESMMSCGQTEKGRFTCNLQYPHKSITCHGSLYDCGFATPVVTEVFEEEAAFTQKYWDITESVKVTRGAIDCGRV